MLFNYSLFNYDSLFYAFEVSTPLFISRELKRHIADIEDKGHDNFLVQIIYGSLLGDLRAEKQRHCTRLGFTQSIIHKAYLMHLWSIFSKAGYCSSNEPLIKAHFYKRTVRYTYSLSFWTYSFVGFNKIYRRRSRLSGRRPRSAAVGRAQNFILQAKTCTC